MPTATCLTSFSPFLISQQEKIHYFYLTQGKKKLRKRGWSLLSTTGRIQQRKKVKSPPIQHSDTSAPGLTHSSFYGLFFSYTLVFLNTWQVCQTGYTHHREVSKTIQELHLLMSASFSVLVQMNSATAEFDTEEGWDRYSKQTRYTKFLPGHQKSTHLCTGSSEHHITHEYRAFAMREEKLHLKFQGNTVQQHLISSSSTKNSARRENSVKLHPKK